jgi:acetolactate synthase-1/2/3 large subunit
VGGAALQGAVHGGGLPEPQLFDRTLRINSVYGAKDSYAAKADYDGGYFDPPIDFAKEAEAAGAYGENVTDSAQIEGALRRGLKAIREEGRRR